MGRHTLTPSSAEIGCVSEMQVASYLIGRGWPVYWPAVHQTHVDLLIDNAGVAESVQVKTVSWTRGKPYIRIGEREYSGKRLHWLAAFDPKTRSVVVIPWKNVAGRRTIPVKSYMENPCPL